MKSLGEMTISEAMPILKEVADANGLNLNRVSDFRKARMLAANLYCFVM